MGLGFKTDGVHWQFGLAAPSHWAERFFTIFRPNQKPHGAGRHDFYYANAFGGEV